MNAVRQAAPSVNPDDARPHIATAGAEVPSVDGGEGIPSRYPGGKNGGGLWQWLVSLMPVHDNYVEPFAGSAAVFRNKPRANCSHLIDKDPDAPSHQLAWRQDVRSFTGCGLEWLERKAPIMDSNWLVYCDPPYVLERRVKQSIYRFEFSPPDHARLLSIVRELPANVMVSGYWSRQYQEGLPGWKVHQRRATTRGGPRIECVWTNFEIVARPKASAATLLQRADAAPGCLAAGPDFRQRFRAKRKARRWLAMLEAMPDWERAYILNLLMKAGQSGLG